MAPSQTALSSIKGAMICTSLALAAAIAITASNAAGQATRPSASGSAATSTKLPFTISKETTAITSPLRADGTVDYVAALNEKYGKGVTPENNGFVLWLKVVGTGDNVLSPKTRDRVLKMCGATPTKPGDEVWETYEDYLKRTKGLTGDELSKAVDGLTDAGRELWTATERPELAEYLKLRDKQLALVAQALARSKWWIPSVASDTDSVLTVLLPSLGRTREVAKALSVRATMRSKTGDITGAATDLATIRRLARHVGSGASLVERLVGIAIDAVADRALGEIGGSGLLTETQCKALSNAVNALTPLPSVEEAVDSLERWAQLDIVAGIATKRPGFIHALSQVDQTGKTSQAVETSMDLIDRDSVDWNEVLKQTNNILNVQLQAIQATRLEVLNAQSAEIKALLTSWMIDVPIESGLGILSKQTSKSRASYTERITHVTISAFVAEVIKSEELRRRDHLETEMVKVILAAAAIKARTGKWPATLEEMVLKDLKAVPKDMYSKGEAAPVKYLVKDKGIVVYSVGENGKDDGGVSDKDKGMDDLAVGVK